MNEWINDCEIWSWVDAMGGDGERQKENQNCFDEEYELW